MTDDTTDTTTRTAADTAKTSLVNALKAYAVTLETDDPTATPNELQPLREFLENRHVVGLGEATHGTREFFRLKHRLIRYLIEELEFRIVGLEANFSETMAINEYVLHGEGSPVAALEATDFWIWTTEEVVAFLDWLRAYNRERPEEQRVVFYGFDTQFTSGPVRAVTDFLEAVDPATLEAVQGGLALLEDGLRSESDDLETKLDRGGSVIDELRDRFNRNEHQYIQATSSAAFELAHRHLRTLEQAYIVNKKLHRDEEPWIARDEFMAETVSWILDYEDPEQIVLWAHNGHIRRGERNDSPDSNHLPMGHHLEETYGDGYYALGFDFGFGSFQAIADSEHSDQSGITEFSVDTLSYGVFDESADKHPVSRESLAEPPLHDVLHEVEDDILLDFETVLADTSVENWLTQTHLCYSIGAVFGEENVIEAYLPLQVTCEFDGLLYVQETTRARHIETE